MRARSRSRLRCRYSCGTPNQALEGKERCRELGPAHGDAAPQRARMDLFAEARGQAVAVPLGVPFVRRRDLALVLLKYCGRRVTLVGRLRRQQWQLRLPVAADICRKPAA